MDRFSRYGLWPGNAGTPPDPAPAPPATGPLFSRSRLVQEAGLDADAVVDGAAAGLSLDAGFCRRAVAALDEAVRAAAQQAGAGCAERPHDNPYTVFSDTWHPALAALSDEEIASSWRLAEYLLLGSSDPVFACLRDVLVQREVRSDAANEFMPKDGPGFLMAGRVAEIDLFLERYHQAVGWRKTRRDVASGVTIPMNDHEHCCAAQWGQLGSLQRAYEMGCRFSERVTRAAAQGGHLRVLQWLVSRGTRWDAGRIREEARLRRFPDIAAWALEA